MYLIQKKVINKAIINGINFFFPAAIGIKQINNITKVTNDTVSIYIYISHTLF